MDNVDLILRNFGQWCEAERSSVPNRLPLNIASLVVVIDGKERGWFKFQPDGNEETLFISTSAETLEQISAGEFAPQLAFLQGKLRLAGSRIAAISAHHVFQALTVSGQTLN